MLKFSQENLCLHFRLIERVIAALVQISTCTAVQILTFLTDTPDVDPVTSEVVQSLTGHFVEECHQDFQNPLELQIRILGTKRPGVIVHPEEKLLAILLVEAHLIRILGEMMTDLKPEIDSWRTHTPHQWTQ